MNTKEVCRALCITEKALRIYEAQGIVIPKREVNSYRNYTEDDLLKLREIMLLREIGFSLREIKQLTDRNIYANNQFTRSLYLQYKAIDCKLVELENIRNTLKESIDIMLGSEKELGQEHFFDNISETLKENKAGRRQWIDKWGFDNKAMKYDRMVNNRTDDELGLFENESERVKCKDKLCSRQRYDLWEVIESRHYTHIESFAEYVRGLGLRIEYKHFVNFSWLVVIER